MNISSLQHWFSQRRRLATEQSDIREWQESKIIRMSVISGLFAGIAYGTFRYLDIFGWGEEQDRTLSYFLFMAMFFGLPMGLLEFYRLKRLQRLQKKHGIKSRVTHAYYGLTMIILIAFVVATIA